MIPAQYLAPALGLLLLTGSLAHARPCVDYASNPRWVGSADLPDRGQTVAAEAGFAYVATRDCCPDSYRLVIFDLSDAAVPVLLGSLDLAGDPADLLIHDTLLFVAFRDSGVGVIDVSNPDTPFPVGFTAHPAITGFSRLSISPDGNVVYVTIREELHIFDVSDPADPTFEGLISGHGPWFNSFEFAQPDLAVAIVGSVISTYDLTDPVAPALIGEYDAEPGCWEYDCSGYRELAVTAERAWTVLRRGWCVDIPDCYCTGESARLVTYDLSDPAVLSPVAGPFLDDADVTGLELFAGRLHVFGTADRIFDVSDPAQPQPLHVVPTDEPADVLHAGAADLLVSVGNSLRVFDITNVDRRFAREGEKAGQVLDVVTQGDHVYFFDSELHHPCVGGDGTVCNHIRVQELDTGLPLPEMEWSACRTSYGYFDAAIRDTEIADGDYYISTGALFRGEFVGPGLPFTDPLPLSTPDAVYEMAASDPYLLLAGRQAGLSVLDASAEPPEIVAAVDTYDTFRIAVSGSLAASMGSDAGNTQLEFRTIAIGALPSPPVHIGELTWPATGIWSRGAWLALEGGVAVVGSRDGVFRTIDVSDPAAPRLAAEVPIEGFEALGWGQTSEFGDLFGRVLYVDASDNGLAAYDVHDPDAPVFLGFASVGPRPVKRILATSDGVFVATATGMVALPLDCMSLVHATLAPEPHGGPGLLLSAERNPFADATAFRFMAPGSPHPALDIYDVTGRRVRSFRTSVDNDGRGSVRWDGRDGAGRPVAPGIYFVRLRVGEVAETRKVVRVR